MTTERAGTSPDATAGRPQAVADADTRETTPLTGSVTAAPDDARRLEAEIERTREQLGQTVQELAARADVKSRAQAKATEVSDRLKGMTAQVRAKAGDYWMPVAMAAGVVALDYVALRQWRSGR